MINILLQEGMITKETIVINQVAMSEITMIVKDVTTTHKEDETPIMTFVDKTETMTIVITTVDQINTTIENEVMDAEDMTESESIT